MRIILTPILLMVIVMAACNTEGITADESDINKSTMDGTVSNHDADSTPIELSSSEQKPTVPEAVSPVNPYPVFEYLNGEKGLTSMDFECAFQLCQDAISDYFSNQVDDNFEKYVENNKLMEYLSLSAEWSKPKREVRKIGLGKAEFQNDESTGRNWFFFYLTIEFYDGGEVVEIIVKESADGSSLVIADWYIADKLYMDDMTRSHEKSINNPDIWEDSDFADEMLRKANEIINEETIYDFYTMPDVETDIAALLFLGVDDAYASWDTDFDGFDEGKALVQEKYFSHLPNRWPQVMEHVEVTPWECYLLLPKYKGTVFTIYEIDVDTSELKEIYSTENPILLRCNFSDVVPSVNVKVEYGGEYVIFNPELYDFEGSPIDIERIYEEDILRGSVK